MAPGRFHRRRVTVLQRTRRFFYGIRTMAMIPETTVDEILRRSNIVEVINSFVPLAKAGGGDWKACCPFHKEKTPSFHVSETKQLYYCFGCQKGGNIITFLREYQNIDYVEALRFLADRYHVVIPATVSPAEERAYRERRSREGRLFDLHREICAFYMRELREHAASPVAQYFATRAIPMDYADKFRIGAAPDSWDAALNYGRKLGFSEEEMVESGIAARNESGRVYDRFRNRLMFAITDESDRVIGFSARIIVKDDSAPKYVNSPETPIFHKGEILYGLAQARESIRRNRFAIVCEGQLDTIALHRAGLDMAVAPQGLAFRAEQAELLKRNADKLYLCFDADAAGQSGTFRVLEFLLPLGMEVRALALDGGKDPDEIMKTQGPEVLHQAMQQARSLVPVILEGLGHAHDLNSVAGKARAADEAVQLLATVPDAIARELYLGELADSLHIPVDQIFRRYRSKKHSARTVYGSTPQPAAPAPAPETYADLRPGNVRHAEASLLLLALHSPEMARRLAELLSDELLSDAPAATVLKELCAMSLNGEWFAGAELLGRLAETPTHDPEVIRLLMQDVSLSEAQCLQILEDCPKELQKERHKKMRRQLLFELKESSDPDRQKEILRRMQELLD